MTEKKRELFLIDGYALIYRFYFAFIKSPLLTKRGENTGAIYGLTSALLKIVEKYAPDYWAVILDTQKPTFRHHRFAQYKATREKMPDELQDQIPRIREVLAALRIPVIELEGYEADDIIGTLSRRASGEGVRVVIISGDKDFCQLVGENVVLLNPGRRQSPDEWVDDRGVVEKLGVPPDKVVDLLALVGDVSDNVPGVPGIGPKTAEKLIREFGSLAELMASLDSLTSKRLREKLLAFRDQAWLSRDLVTLEADIPVEFDFRALGRVEPDRIEMERIFRELEFYSFLKDRPEEVRASGEGDYRVVSSYEEIETLVGLARGEGRLCLDCETTSLDPLEAGLVGIALSVEEGKAFYLPIAHTEKRPLERERALAILKPVLESSEVEKVGQNLKYDFSVLRMNGIRLDGLSFDTMIASYLIAPDRQSHGLDFLAREILGHQMITYSEVVGKGRKSFAEVPIDQAMRYSCEDVDYTLRLANRFQGTLEEMKLYSLFRDVEVPLVAVLAEMEMTGVAIDIGFFDGLSRRMQRELDLLERDIYALAGLEFNINSHAQLSKVLFERLKLPYQKRTKTGFSTDSEVLAKLAEEHELPRRLLEYRELAKLKSTYVDALPRQVNPVTSRIHTSYNQVVTSTGRLSSSGPNLQNIPVRTPIGREIRKGFITGGEDRLFLSCDYSQIELRIMAHLSRDESMARAFGSGEDIHRQTAALVFGIPYERVPAMLRSRAKEVNFGVIYGMGAFGLSKRLGISIEEAKAFIESYFQRFRGVKAYIDRAVSEARERGYVTTIMGRRRYLPGLGDRNRSVRDFAERTAINSPIQGSAADIIKVAMIDIQREIERRGLRSRMIIQVHDELVFDVYRDELETVKALARERMEGAVVLRVPIVVDMSTGANWYDCKGEG
ncbi:MAG: DNA polymerase I [Candidatus Glassbacteria bacterium RBG_16_58_8]|uniref:DNA polymerase I n=1 Tax=Candidatus Glassbacteria bacterium RBG_16_58_8 TaxID=1817866 RepID=A0A1F5YDR7_9BACT|nr:MAG: DNA polymerase I [Candidatus Glassbacteria bacterium RBG_16_58_8]